MIKNKIIQYLQPRLFTLSTLIGILIIFFTLYYHSELSDFIKWFFTVPARQLITNIVNDKSFTEEIIEGIGVVVGGLFINKCRTKKNKGTN